MSKKDKYEVMDTGEHLTKKEHEELQKIIDEINEQAKKVVNDYTKNPSEMSGSVIQIHESSPFLDNEKSIWTKIGDVIKEVMTNLKDKQGENDDK